VSHDREGDGPTTAVAIEKICAQIKSLLGSIEEKARELQDDADDESR
jgi:hypothetical protein